MSRIKARLKHVEGRAEKLPPSKAELAGATERLRCRYTITLDVQRQVAHWLVGKPDEYAPRDPTPEEQEQIREHARMWALPCASEKTIEEAHAYLQLAEDTAERALDDARFLGGGQWRLWVEELYLPALEAHKKPTRKALAELVLAVERRIMADCAGYYGSGLHKDFAPGSLTPPSWWKPSSEWGTRTIPDRIGQESSYLD